IDDLDGDGKLDVVTWNRGADNPPGLDNIAVLWGQGNGFFGTPELFSLGSDVSGPASIAFGDFDEDGKPDLLTANSGSSNITLLLENGLRSFATPKIFDVGIGAASPVAVAVADLNGDHKPDLVTANYNSNNVTVLLGNNSGGFGAPNTTSLGAGASFPRALAIADFNKDNKPDVVTA